MSAETGIMMAKNCSKCGEVKPLDGFHKNKTLKDGIYASCKVCVLAAIKLYDELNPGRKAATSAAWHKANPEKRSASEAAYRNAHRKKLSDREAAWRKANPEKSKLKYESWRKRNIHRVGALHNASARARSKALTTGYIVSRINAVTGLRKSNIPPELIEAKRAHLKLTRKIKELKA